MENTYKVEARSNKAQGINVEYKGIPTAEDALGVAAILAEAFPCIDVTSEYSGEVIYSLYISLDYFDPQTSEAMAICAVECNKHF
jgi:hypothetical protein